MITSMTGKNQVTVPAALVEKIHLHPGTRLEWAMGDTEQILVVRVLPDIATLASQVRGSGRKHRKRGTSAVAKLIRERARDDREGR
jgi:bifunctional DNA-binding transcriptional regulator/antitoxin component of YhaV-PrlF toxin-antitoxin module